MRGKSHDGFLNKYKMLIDNSSKQHVILSIHIAGNCSIKHYTSVQNSPVPSPPRKKQQTNTQQQKTEQKE
jgi:hypothetical protein